jgi:2-dehydropantoate 2-reductase
MNYCVIGPGAMGCLFAGYLTRAGCDTILLDYRPERVSIISNQGLVIEEIGGTQSTIPVTITSTPPAPGRVGAVIICVKSYDTETAARMAAQIADAQTLVVTMQNGIGNVERLDEAIGRGHIVAGITSHGTTVLGAGKVRHAGLGDTFLGLVKKENLSGPAHARLKELAEDFEKSGFITQIVNNIHDLLWSKLIVNVGINALTSLTRLKNGELLNNAETEVLLEMAVREGLEVGQKEGVNFIYENPMAQVKKVCQLTAQNISSMLQDVLKKKKTEIDFINGAIVEKGRAHGLPTPVNEVLTRLVRSLQATYDLQVC